MCAAAEWGGVGAARKRGEKIMEFRIDSDGVDPSLVPSVALAGGQRMPMLGMGTFGSDHVAPAVMGEAVLGALRAGCRHIDSASVYANEKETGAALRAALAGGVKRESLFVASKLWNNAHAPKDVIPSCEKSLRLLGLDYLDMYLIHWPFPNFHPPGCDANYLDKNARPYSNDAYLAAWGEMEKLLRQGKTRGIGVSNMTVAKLKQFLPRASVRPAVNQLECHPHFQQPELTAFLKAERIQPVGFCPLGSPNRPERDRAPGDTVDMADPVVVDIARRLELTPAQVCLKWALQNGVAAIPLSTRRANCLSNLKAVLPPALTDDDLKRLSGVDKNCRLVKGQVFCWKHGQPWEELWDLDGRVAAD